MSTDQSDEGDYRHLVDLACPECYPDPIETVLLYSLEGGSMTLKCEECGLTGSVQQFEEYQ